MEQTEWLLILFSVIGIAAIVNTALEGGVTYVFSLTTTRRLRLSERIDVLISATIAVTCIGLSYYYGLRLFDPKHLFLSI